MAHGNRCHPHILQLVYDQLGATDYAARGAMRVSCKACSTLPARPLDARLAALGPLLERRASLAHVSPCGTSVVVSLPVTRSKAYVLVFHHDGGDQPPRTMLVYRDDGARSRRRIAAPPA